MQKITESDFLQSYCKMLQSGQLCLLYLKRWNVKCSVFVTLSTLGDLPSRGLLMWAAQWLQCTRLHMGFGFFIRWFLCSVCPLNIPGVRFPVLMSFLVSQTLERYTILKLFIFLGVFPKPPRAPLRETYLCIPSDVGSMFLESIIDIHAGLSMDEMSMMGMTQIGAQVKRLLERTSTRNTVQAKM